MQLSTKSRRSAARVAYPKVHIRSMDESGVLFYTPGMFLLRWFTNALLVIVVTYVVPGITVGSFWTALLVALALGVLNAVVRPILVILTLPITLLTLGLFTLVINGVLFWLVSTVVKGFNVEGFWAAFLGAAVLWVFSFFTNAVFKTLKR